MNLGRWNVLRSKFRSKSPQAIAGISGGRTSGMMAALLESDTVLTFQNTGQEDERTYEFLAQVDEWLGNQIVWMEYVPPKQKGARPRESSFRIVNFKTADRSGGPFESLLQALADYRETMGKPPVAPWARQRLCTAYLKQKTQEKYAAHIGLDVFDSFVGLRFDEPDRVFKIKARDTQAKTFRAPLYDARITKSDVIEFWSLQPFNLTLPERAGNCTGCFLKDQSDLARVLVEPNTDLEFWLRMEDTYPNFGGQNFPGYRQLAREASAREQIERMIRDGMDPKSIPNTFGLRPQRHRLVVLQEKRRVANEIPDFACQCEGSFNHAIDEEEE